MPKAPGSKPEDNKQYSPKRINRGLLACVAFASLVGGVSLAKECGKSADNVGHATRRSKSSNQSIFKDLSIISSSDDEWSDDELDSAGMDTSFEEMVDESTFTPECRTYFAEQSRAYTTEILDNLGTLSDNQYLEANHFLTLGCKPYFYINGELDFAPPAPYNSCGPLFLENSDDAKPFDKDKFEHSGVPIYHPGSYVETDDNVAACNKATAASALDELSAEAIDLTESERQKIQAQLNLGCKLVGVSYNELNGSTIVSFGPPSPLDECNLFFIDEEDGGDIKIEENETWYNPRVVESMSEEGRALYHLAREGDYDGFLQGISLDVLNVEMNKALDLLPEDVVERIRPILEGQIASYKAYIDDPESSNALCNLLAYDGKLAIEDSSLLEDRLPLHDILEHIFAKKEFWPILLNQKSEPACDFD